MFWLYLLLLCLASCQCSRLIHTESDYEDILTPETSLGPRVFNVSGKIVVPDPPIGCSSPNNPGELKGNIALVASDYCYPFTKAKHMQDAGALAVLLKGYRSTVGLLVYYHGGGDENEIVIPVLEISESDADKIGENTTVMMIADKSPIAEMGEIPWIFYSLAFTVYNGVILGFAFIKFRAFALDSECRRFPLFALGFIILTCLCKWRKTPPSL